MKKSDLLTTIEPFLKKIQLIPPDAAENLRHLYADYVELLVLFSSNLTFTATEILDKFKEAGIIKQVSNSGDQAQQNDLNEKRIDQILQILEDRAFNYKGDYPFLFEHRSITLRQTFTDIQKIYILLLISSNLNIFNKYYTNLTTDFEEISYQALLNFMPKSAIVRAFGKNSKYKGYAIDKIRELANDVQIPIDDEALGRISPTGKQERGLDVIGWVPFDDYVGNKLILLAQCTCEKKWTKKQTEAKRYKNYFNFYRIDPNTALFIPYALLDFQQSGFHQSDELIDTLLFERKRILNYLHDLTFFNALDSKIIVDKCLEIQNDIV